MIGESHYNVDEPIYALATARGQGALAIIRTSGPGSVALLAAVFSRPQVLQKTPGHSLVYGWLLDGEKKGLDEVLLSVFRAPASYTGQESVEISCHGGLAVVDAIMALLRSQGFRDAAPGEFTFRAFVHGKMDLTRAEAVREITEARSNRARALAASRLSGSILKRVDDVKKILIEQAAVGALALDYPEDEVEEVPFNLEQIEQAQQSLEKLLDSYSVAKIYQEGLSVAFAGASNVGKSSLFNRFLCEQRSIVTEQAGTTRDWLEVWIELEGIPLRLIDTAGLRQQTDDPIEREGIRRSQELLKNVDLIIAVVDGAQGLQAPVELEQDPLFSVIRKQWGLENRVIRVWNKADQGIAAPEGWLPVSALTGEGFSDLEKKIVSWALDGGLAPEGDAPVIDSARQKRLLERTCEALKRFSAGWEEGAEKHPLKALDLLAEDLRDALENLGELTGAVTGTDILETMFSQFCLGK